MLKPILFAMLALTSLVACKKTPAKVAPPPTSYVEGVLSYRSGCQAGPVAPFQGQVFDGGPVLYLTDLDAHVKSGYVKPDAAGRFAFPGVTAGEYRLRLAAGSLHEFWIGFPVNGVRVVVPTTPRRINLGVTCADTMPPQNLNMRAQWNATDGAEAAPGAILHLEDAAGPVRLAVWADTDGERRQLDAEWSAADDAAAAMTLDGAELAWAPGAISKATLALMAGDGKGSFVPLSVPLRMHLRRAAGVKVGGWQAFSDAATLAVFTSAVTQGAMISPVLAGARFTTTLAAGGAEGSLTSAASYLATTTAVSAVVDIARLDAGAEIALDLVGPFGTFVGARLRMSGVQEGRLELIDANGTVVAAEPWTPTPTAIVELSFDGAAGQAAAAVGEFAPGRGVSAPIAQPATRPADRLAPRFTVRGAPGTTALFDVVCEGLYVSEQAWLFKLPIVPGSLDERTFDEFLYADEPGAMAYVESGLYFGAGELLISAAKPRPLSAYLVDYEGSASTIFTDRPAEWVSLFSTIEAVDAETMAPVNGGQVMLY